MVDQFKDWRGYTPILLVVIMVLGGGVSYLTIDKLNTMNDKTDKLFTIVGDVKSSFEDYRVTSEGRFSSIETQLADIKAKQ